MTARVLLVNVGLQYVEVGTVGATSGEEVPQARLAPGRHAELYVAKDAALFVKELPDGNPLLAE